MCKGGELDLSVESLTSHAARQVLRELPTTDPEFFAEISQPRSHVGVTPTLTPEQEASEDASSNDEDGPTDDSDVPFLEVHAHHHESLNPSSSLSDLAQVYVPNDTGGLTTTAAAEDTLVESVNDVVVDVTPQDDPQPTCRNRRRNVLYNEDWWADSRGSDDEEMLDDKDPEYKGKRSRKPARKT
jgi:hypothetical protein